jgi:predicted nucleotidyltransferase
VINHSDLKKTRPWTREQIRDARMAELAALLDRKVDLVSRRAIERSPNWIRRQAILASAETVHVAR